MSLEKIIEFIFGAIILGAIGFLGTQVFDMRGTLSSVNSKLESTDSRVSRIAEVLPEIKARVAWEEVNEPIKGFVLTVHPIESSSGKLITSWLVYNSETSMLKRYSASLSTRHKEYVADVVAGKIRTADQFAPTFTELAYHSSENKEPVMIPAKIDPDTSYVIRNTGMAKIESFLQKISEKKPTISLSIKFANWKQVSENLELLTNEQNTETTPKK